MAQYPLNLQLLEQGEQSLREQAIKLIEADEDLSLHIQMIEAVMDTLQFYRMNYDEKTQEQTAIKLLGARLFNAIGAAVKLSLSGYYQAATTHTRDILETSFLLDYFSTDAKLIMRWSEVSEDVRTKEFSQVKIRSTLDQRDGYTTRKRQEHYKLLCSLASHPTFLGLELLRPEPGKLAIMGPFHSSSLLKASIEELVKVCLLASDVFVRFFPSENLDQMRVAVARIEASAAWFKRVFGVDKTKETDELRRLLAAVEATGNAPSR
jgi:hypothetical protein